MSPERWRRVEELYHAVLEREPQQRIAFLSASCQGDQDLRQEVESLLAQSDSSGELKRPIWKDAARAMDATQLKAGEQLGPYEIEGLLGSGGMGQVYKARDTRLGRLVAIKISSQQFSDRFEREARTISALNHPNICTLYDVGPNYLVMELVEGETLAARLRREKLPIDLALRYAAQIADALAAAHAQGIVHRDLKPANIMVTKAGQAKVLDFGLAKLTRPATQHEGATETNLTGEGVVVGTAAYMSPEQAEGKPTDARSDIFSLGSVLYEMVTGRQAFSGESPAGITAEILRGEPPAISSLQPLSPLQLAHIIRRCMAKEPGERWQSASDIKRELDWVAGNRMEAAGRITRKPRIGLLALGATMVVAVLLLALANANGWLRKEAVPTSTVRFWITLPEGARLIGGETTPEISVSPDGRKVAMVLIDSSGAKSLWIHHLETHSTQRLYQTDGADFPFWSPDGDFIAFFSDRRLRRISVAGGEPQTICTVSNGLGGTWNQDGVIVFAVAPSFCTNCEALSVAGASADTSLLYQVSAFGGVATPAATLNKEAGEITQRWPQFLPDGKHLLYFSRNQHEEKTGTYVQRLGSGGRKFVLANRVRAGYAAPDHLMFVRNQTLFAQYLDSETFQLRGEPISVVEGVASGLLNGGTGFNTSLKGVLVYLGFSDEPRRRLIWLDRQGKEIQTVTAPGPYGEIFLSPDEKRLAVTMPLKNLDPTGVVGYDVRVLEFSRGLFFSIPRELVPVLDPVWAPDSQRIVVAVNRPGKSDLLAVDTYTGRTTLLYSDDNSPKFIDNWSRDGRLIVYRTGTKVMVLPLVGERKPRQVLDTRSYAFDFRLSPNGRWITYVSTESEVAEVYVASFPSFDQQQRVSTAKGSRPFWRGDGKELFYLTPDTKLMAVQVKEKSTLEIGTPTLLFQTPLNQINPLVQYAVARDGKKFLFIEPGKSEQVGVIVNWHAGLRR